LEEILSKHLITGRSDRHTFEKHFHITDM
jgi:hypothetical protein